MRKLEVDNRGNVNVVMALVTTTIVLMVATIVTGKLSTMGSTLGLATEPLMQFNNITLLAYQGLGISSIGMLVLAALGILSYFGIGFGGKGKK
jgi:hypothetical protein